MARFIHTQAGKFLGRTAIVAGLAIALLGSGQAVAERLKDLASVQGVRNNQLVGYGLVVGLDGSGDQTTQTPFTTQSIINMLAQLGTTLPTTQSLQLKNVAAVMVTANLPRLSRELASRSTLPCRRWATPRVCVVGRWS
jgi:flagellar P-ring protein precursor FlgI